MKLYLRPVEKKDYEKILEWRNDPDVRFNSLNQHIIPINEHIKYWDNFLENILNSAFIIVCDNKDIGVLKLKNIDVNTYEIDIFISKLFRNKGLGTKILELAKDIAIQKKIKKLIAKIKYDNEISKRAFMKVGFLPKLIYYDVEIK
jgi:RimJ/RimL family protein N-acetyltransferase